MVRFCKFEMNNPTIDTVWELFDRVDVEGRSMAVCELCQHQIVANRGTMCMDYRMRHCKPVNGPTQTDDPLASKPLSDKAQAPDRLVVDPKSSLLWKRYCNCINNNVNTIDNGEDSEISDTHTNSVDSEDNCRVRDRTLHMLHYLASGPSDEAYASIIANANGQIIRTITEVGRAYKRGDLGDLSPTESLALSRYKESIDRFTGYMPTTERRRNMLLEPRRKPRRALPESAEYVPMLLTLALARDVLETHVDNADASTDEDESDEDSSDAHHSSNSGDSEDSSDDDSCSTSDSVVGEDEQGGSTTSEEDEGESEEETETEESEELESEESEDNDQETEEKGDEDEEETEEESETEQSEKESEDNDMGAEEDE